MASATPTWLDKLLNKLIALAGVQQPQRGTLDFAAGFTVTDDPTNDTLHVTAVGTAGLPGQTNLTLANGSNENVDPASKTVLHIGGPTAPFSIGGFVAPAAPVTLLVVNTTSQPMTLNHEDVGSAAANRIDTQSSGAPAVTIPSKRVAVFVYDTTAARWQLISIGLQRPPAVSVQDFGAFGNGTTDDTAAIQAAITAATGYPITLPPGTFKLTSTLTNAGSTLILRGAGQSVSKLSGVTASMTMIGGSLAGFTDLILEDLTVDATNEAFVLLSVDGAFFRSVTCRRVTLTSTTESNLVSAQYIQRLKFEECLFEGNGKAVSNGVAIFDNVISVVVEKCQFRGLYNGVSGSSTNAVPAVEDITVRNCVFDMMYYALPALASGSGSGVSYIQGNGTSTVSSLTDTGASFSVFAFGSLGVAPTQFSYIRVMPTRATGTLQFAAGARVIDSRATFLSDGIIPGEIVRSGTSYAIITGVESNTQLNIEEWLDQTTTQPVAPPAAGTAYTVLGVILGMIGNSPGPAGNTLTLIGHMQWSDLNGTAVTPAAHTLYELMAVPNYPVAFTGPCRRSRIEGNTIRRSYSDGISPFGDQCLISHNIIADCQDVGITIDASASGQGDHHVHDNLILRQGRFGIFVGQDKVDVHDNHIRGWGCRALGLNSGVTNDSVSAIGVESQAGGANVADSVLIHHNIIDADSKPVALIGIGLANATNARVFDNVCLGTAVDILITGSASAGSHIRHETDKLVQASNLAALGVPPGQLIEIISSVSPDNIIASPGSLWRNKTDGTVWAKTVGTSGPGWTPLAPWTPQAITDLLAWYRADLGVVSSTTFLLYDQSDTHFDLSATGSARPTAGTGIGGLAKITFDGVANALISASATESQPFEYWLVVQFAGAWSSNQYAVDWSFSNAHGNQMSFIRSGTGQVEIYAGTALTATTTPLALHAYDAQFNGGSSELDIDGTSAATGAAGAGGGFGLCIGGAFGGTASYAAFDFYELIALPRLATSGERAQITAYLKARYGL